MNIKKMFSHLFLFSLFVCLSSCGVDKSIIPQNAVNASVHQAYVTDFDEQTGGDDTSTNDTAEEPELEPEWDLGGKLEYFSDEMSVSVSQTVGEHDLLSTDNDELGKVDLAFRTIEINGYWGWKMEDPTGGGYVGLGLAHADFDETTMNVDSLDIDDAWGFTIPFGVIQYLDPKKRVFVDIGMRVNLIITEVGINDGGAFEETDLRMFTRIGPILSVGIRF